MQDALDHVAVGKIVAGLIAEGQSEPAVLQEFFDQWVRLVLDGMPRLRICSAARMQASCDQRQNLNC
jgi:hypothetical protein